MPPSTGRERGTIADRNGRVLAMDSPLYNVAVWRPETKRDAFPAEAARLASITGVSETEIMDRWSKGSSDFFYLAKRAQPQVAQPSRKPRTAGAFAGVVVEKVAGRLYPEKTPRLPPRRLRRRRELRARAGSRSAATTSSSAREGASSSR